jgi:hypothetical protein
MFGIFSKNFNIFLYFLDFFARLPEFESGSKVLETIMLPVTLQTYGDPEENQTLVI